MKIDPESLQARLDSLIGGDGPGHAAVAVWLPDRIIEARAGRTASQKTIDGEPCYSPGCTAKLFTAMLASQQLAARGCSLDAPVHGFDGPWQGIDALDGVTVRDLLEHRHGIDDSAIDIDAVTGVDEESLSNLCSQVGEAPRLYAPGRYYSYSQIGHVLIAAILERITGLGFGELLMRGLFVPSGARVLLPETGRIAASCPATGKDLRISLAGMVKLLIRHRPGCSAPESAARRISPLPGWHPVETGVLCGWKAYADGWFGHQSVGPGTTMLARVNHEQNVAVAVAAEAHSASLVAARLLGDLLPVFRRVQLPGSITSTGTRRPDLARFAGHYSRQAHRLTITPRGNDRLDVACSEPSNRLRPDSPLPVTSGIRAGDNIFLLRERRRSTGAFVQLIDDDGGFSYLWNGQCLFARLRSDDSGSRTH